jgi:hypothetical protein
VGLIIFGHGQLVMKVHEVIFQFRLDFKYGTNLIYGVQKWLMNHWLYHPYHFRLKTLRIHVKVVANASINSFRDPYYLQYLVQDEYYYTSTLYRINNYVSIPPVHNISSNEI